MKKRWISLLLSVIMMLAIWPSNASAATINDFTDVSQSEWYYTAVDHAAKANWFGGTTKTTFEPHTAMNRGMFATVLGRFANIPSTYTSASPSFADVMENSYYAPYSAWASDIDVVSGVGNNRFAPDETISREQMAVMLFRYSMKSGVTVAHNENIYNAFSDTNKVSAYAVDALKWATYYGIIKGSGGKINPQSKATRAEVAQIFQNFESFTAAPTPVPTPTPTPETPAPSPEPTPQPENPTMPWEDYDPQYTRKTGQSTKDADDGHYDYDLANEIMDKINELRVQNGLGELEYHPQIQEWASVRAKEHTTIHANPDKAHVRPDASHWSTVGKKLNAENLLWGSSYSDYYKANKGEYALRLIDSWYNSSPHKNSMLSSIANLHGLSCYVQGEKIYVAHLFSNSSLYFFDSLI